MRIWYLLQILASEALMSLFICTNLQTLITDADEDSKPNSRPLKVSEYDQECHNHKLQNNPRHYKKDSPKHLQKQD